MPNLSNNNVSTRKNKKKKAKQNSYKSNNNANINPFDLLGNMRKRKILNELYVIKKLPKKSTIKILHLTINPK